MPFPVAEYRAGYAVKSVTLNIPNKYVKGAAYAVRTNNKNLEDYYDPSNLENFVFFNILVLTDQPEAENSTNHVFSRNYPHHTCQGRSITSIGNIDWVVMHLASNERFAIVNMKYFNLELGQTILVAPQLDGSIRFKQVALPNTSTVQIDKYLLELEKDQEVIKFFSNSKNI